MNNKLIFIIIISIFSVSFLCAENVAVLEDIIKPDMIQIKDGKLYVLEKTSVFIYLIKDFKLIKKFGREGEGPMEFIARPFGPPMTISFYLDQLVVNSNNKLSYFTMDGKFLKEEKTPPNTVYYKIKKGYLGIGTAVGDDSQPYICFRVFNEAFQNPKMLYQSEICVSQGRNFMVPMNGLNYYPLYKDNIFIVNGKKGFVIDCFDTEAKKLYTIEKKDYKRRKVTDHYKKYTMKWFKTHPIFRQFFERIKDQIKFKEYFPEIKSITIDNDLIYVITNKIKKGLRECIVMSMKGKIVKQAFVPLQEIGPYTYYPLLYSIENGIFYSLLENEENETYELHRKKIN